MSLTQPQGDASVFRKPAAPPPARPAKRSPDARGDRSFAIPAKIASSLPRTVLEQLAYLMPEQRRAFLWRYRGQAKSPVAAFLFLLVGWHYLYLRRRALQVLFWLTLGGLCVWWVVDLARIRRLVQEHNKKVAAGVMRALWG